MCDFFLIETQYFKMYIKEKKSRSHVKDFPLNSSIKTCWFTQKNFFYLITSGEILIIFLIKSIH